MHGRHTATYHICALHMYIYDEGAEGYSVSRSTVCGGLGSCLLVTQEIMARLDTRGEVEGGARRVRHIHMLLVPAILLFFKAVPTSSQSEDRRR